MKGKEFKPPKPFSSRGNAPTVFLAGSIEMGKAEDWQSRFSSRLLKLNYNVLNPRRDDWDSSWEQNIQNPQFYQQVNWELNGLEIADLVIFYFAKDTLSPISLMELGLLIGAATTKIMVYCDPGYLRKGNVDIVCSRYNIQTFENEELIFKELDFPTLSF